ncbi:STAS domain-containing protein [Nocardia sp. IFM 10818]
MVRVEGELDAAVLPEFSAALERAVAASFRAVVVDLRLTRFLSIGSASALASAKELAALAGVDLRVVACRREVERVLEVTGLRPLFQYYSSVQDALEA